MHSLTLLLETRAGRIELEAPVDDERPASLLYEAIAEGRSLESGFGLRVERSGERVHPDAPLGYYRLRQGDVLRVVEGRPDGPPPRADAPWSLRGLTGSVDGASVPLEVGSWDLGREPGPEGIVVADTSVSRRHARVEVTTDSLTVVDLGSTNGTLLNGAGTTGATRVEPGDRITMGEVVFEAVRPEPPAEAGPHLDYAAGTLRFNRPPRVTTEAPVRRFSLPAPPDTPSKRRLPFLASLLPVAIGGAMFAFTQNPLTLITLAAAPLMMVGTAVGDRRSGRRDFRDKKAEFDGAMRSFVRDAGEARKAAEAWLEARYPPAETVLERARVRSPEIWHRRPVHDDFLHLRVGTASQSPMLTVTTPDRGDPDLLGRARRVAAKAEEHQRLPLPVPLRDAGVVGVVGAHDRSAPLVRWIVGEMAVHHSPREAAVAVLAPGRTDEWDWAKWLPHARALTKRGTSLADTDETAASLFGSLKKLVEDRASRQAELIAGAAARYLPHVVLVVQPPLRIPPADVAEFLDLAPQHGVSVIWIADDPSVLPGACEVVIAPEDRSVTFSAGGRSFDDVESESLDENAALALVLAMTPLRDVAASDDQAGIPDRVNLVDLLEPQPTSEEAVIDRWAGSGDSLATVFGSGADGPFTVDVIEDGPHGLIGGTTGAGKSELLQTLIGSLAASYPPTRVNFVLIDYKGGAAFKDCVELPHTVGFVTDLDGRLAERAITSLEAELRWREHVLAGRGFKDLAEMRDRAPTDAPPNLLLVVDEFAALKSEVPEFIDGVVDIAQRGRSLGVHLLLATQKPRGVISADIQANTNLRIALRVTDAAESTDIIGIPGAAELSRRLPGRAFVRTGSSEVAEVQVGYVGAPIGGDAPVVVPAHTFRITPGAAMPVVPQTVDGDRSALTVIVECARRAAERLDIPPQRRPWQPPLEARVALADRESSDVATPSVVAGVLDAPQEQATPPFVLDLEAHGSAVIFGTAGAGKTSALRTIAAALAADHGPSMVHCYGLDFAGRGLAPISRLPVTGDVVFGDDLERVRRLLGMLAAIAEQRRQDFAAVGAGTLPEYRRATGQETPAIVVLVDGFGQAWSTLEPLDRGIHADLLAELVSSGRGVGLHFVLTADRRSAIPPMLATTIPCRILMRLANADEFSALGMKPPVGQEKAPPGRCWAAEGEVQFAVLTEGGEDDGAAQSRALQILGDALPPAQGEVAPSSVRTLAESLTTAEIDAVTPGSLAVPVGVEESTLSTVSFDLVREPLVLVAGPPSSGRSTALATISGGFADARPDGERFLLGSRRSSLFDAEWTAAARGIDDADPLLTEVLALLVERDGIDGAPPLLLVVDDADDFTEGVVAAKLQTVTATARDAGGVFVASMTNFKAARAFTPWVQAMRHGRSGLLLQPDLEVDGDVFHLRLPKRAGFRPPPGRAVMVSGGELLFVQVAMPPA